MLARIACCAFVVSIFVLIAGCGSKSGDKDAQPTGPVAQDVATYMQKLIPGLELKADAVEGLVGFQTQLTKKDDKGLTMVSINHKGRYEANGAVLEMTIMFRKDHMPSNEELLRYSDGLLRVAGYSDQDAGRIAEQTWNMPDPQKDGNRLNRIYDKDGGYLAVVDGRSNFVPYVNISTRPKEKAK